MKKLHVFVPGFLYAVTMLIFQIKRIISSEKWYNYFFFFFFENAKIWVRRTTLNGEKKEDGLFEKTYLAPPNIHVLPGAWCDHFST